MSESWRTEGELNTKHPSHTVYCALALWVSCGIQHHLPNYCLTYHREAQLCAVSLLYCTQKSLEDLQYKITLHSKVYWWKKANFWSNLKLSMSVDFSTSTECQDYDPEITTILIMKDWGRWRWHLKFTVRFKSLLKFHQILYSWVTEFSTPVHYYSTYVLHVQYMCTIRNVAPCPRLMALIRL